MSRILLIVIFLMPVLFGLCQTEDNDCRFCRRKLDSTNVFINGIPHEFYERLQLAVTDAILNYKAWFSRPGSSKADFLTDDSRHQEGDVRHDEYIGWRQLLPIPDSIRKNSYWRLDVEITRSQLNPDLLFLVRRKAPYRLVKIYNGGKKLDTFYLPIRDSLPQFDSLFMVLAQSNGPQFFNMMGVSGNLEIESSLYLRWPYGYLRYPPNLFWARLTQFGVDAINSVHLINDSFQNGKFRLYSTYNQEESLRSKGVMERGAIIKCINKEPYDSYYEFIFFSNDRQYTHDPDTATFYEIRRIWDFTRRDTVYGQNRWIFPLSYTDTQWHLKKVGTRKEADTYCRATYGVGIWAYIAGEDARTRPIRATE